MGVIPWELEEGDDGSPIWRAAIQGVVIMDESDIEVTTKGLIPVYIDTDQGRTFVGYAEFERNSNILKMEIDTEAAGTKLKEALRLGISDFSISTHTHHNKENQ